MSQSTLTLVKDGNNIAVQAPQFLKYQDAAASPVVSPVSAVPVAPGQAFKIPAGAVNLVFNSTGKARYGDNVTLDGSGTGKGYKIAAAGMDTTVPCGNLAQINVAADAGTVTLDFFFEMMGT